MMVLERPILTSLWRHTRDDRLYPSTNSVEGTQITRIKHQRLSASATNHRGANIRTGGANHRPTRKRQGLREDDACVTTAENQNAGIVTAGTAAHCKNA
jgi:hypothetical protein